MSLYKRLNKSGLIINQKITSKPNRLRPKVMGYMWGGKLTVYLKDGTKIAFSLWHHFYNDTCGNWTPPEEELEKADASGLLKSTLTPSRAKELQRAAHATIANKESTN